MVTLEQVKLLETKVAKAIEYVGRISGENSQLRATLDAYRKRIDELEVLVQQFKEDQGRIEKGIISALDRLNQFEDAIEKSLSTAAEGFPAGTPGPGKAAPEAGAGIPAETLNEPPQEARKPEPAEDPVNPEGFDFSGAEPEAPEEPDLSDDGGDLQELDIF
jgi:hypothetical protein